MNYEAWRPALVAYYRKTGSIQMAENLGSFGFPLDARDKQRIEALQAALALAPVELRRAA